MTLKSAALLLFATLLSLSLSSEESCRISLVWPENPGAGSITVTNGTLGSLRTDDRRAPIRSDSFRFPADAPCRLEVEVTDARLAPGADPTLVSVQTRIGSFSFFLRDVSSNYPIWVPQYRIAILPADDPRDYARVATDIKTRGSLTKLQQIETQRENSFEQAETIARRLTSPIWLGLSRDMRIFEIAEELPESFLEEKMITPRNATSGIKLPETGDKPVNYRYALGRGVGFRDNIRRSLEQGCLPIYHSTLTDDDVVYRTVAFVSFEASALAVGTVGGTDYIVSDKFSNRVFPQDQREAVAAKIAALDYPEQTVLYSRTRIENRGRVPRYAWMKAPKPDGRTPYQFDPETGCSSFTPERVFCVAKLNGHPLHQEEIAVLLAPGESIDFEFYLPHQPIPPGRARALATRTFDESHAEAIRYWEGKLAQGGNVRLPERRIDELVRAGLLHLDLITYGEEPAGTLSPNVGVYGPIGTESAPIIQFFASMGWDDVAVRALDYFLETQQPDGRIENFNGYTVETGAALWCFGEVFRYTRDTAWVARSADRLLRACDYLIGWRGRNKQESLRGRGYGMIEGKVADPVDPYHQFLLNGYGYLGLRRVAEALEAAGRQEAHTLKAEAAAWREDIRASFFNALARSPLVPLGDGTWSPTASPWTELPGPRLLYQEARTFRSHGTFTAPDALLSPFYLVFCEVIDPDEPAAQMLLRYHSELLFQDNTAFSQPYYSRHNWFQAREGMVKPFLNTYYNTLAAHIDRETYSFWEHYFKLSPHKTHEEAWFLMETRWMLYQERGDTLDLLRVAPRAWLADGERIELNGVRSHFGALDVAVESRLNKGYIEAHIQCDPARKPRVVRIRLPHPEGHAPIRISGGRYDPETESVIIAPFSGEGQVRLTF